MSKTLKMICKSTVDSKTMNFCFALNFVLLTKNSTTNIWNFLWPWLSLWSCITISMQKLHVLLVVLAKPQLSLWIHVNIDRLNYARTFLVIFLVIVNWGLGNKVIWYSKCLFVNETIFFWKIWIQYKSCLRSLCRHSVVLCNWSISTLTF